jgi:ADYC domain-containing protein
MARAIRWRLVLAAMAAFAAGACGTCPAVGQCHALLPPPVGEQQCPDDPNNRPKGEATRSVGTAAKAQEPDAPDTTCGTWLCQTNAASLGDGLYFHELDFSGNFANDAGIKYVGFQLSNQVLAPEVDDKGIVGTIAGDPATKLAGNNVADAVITLERESNGQRYEVRIVNPVGKIRYWVAGDPPAEAINTYELLYRKIDQKGNPRCAWRSLCTARDVSSEWSAMGSTHALIFSGDRYDPHTRMVSILDAKRDKKASDWVNIACAGSAAAKMHLLRHTETGSLTFSWTSPSTGKTYPPQGVAPPYRTTLEERQAMLRMITDDICGTGHTFTRDGESVYYADVLGWHPFQTPVNVTSIEALWGPNGAICLTQARREKECVGSTCQARAACLGKPAGKLIPDCTSFGLTPATWPNWRQIPLPSGITVYGISANPGPP